MEPQAELFPRATPETLLAMCRRLEARVLAIAPEMTRADCWAMLGQQAIAELALDAIDRRIRSSAEWQARQALPVLTLQEPVLELRPGAAAAYRH